MDIKNLHSYLYRKHLALFHKANIKDFYTSLINAGNLCFDIGAHNGRYTKVFTELGAKTVAVEPQKECVAIIKNFISSPLLTIKQLAVCEKVGTANIHICNESEVSSLSSEFISFYKENGKLKWDELRVIETTTLDKLIEEFGVPDYCKIDVEGLEHMVLLGLHHRIPLISFEFTHPFKVNAIQCLDRLEQIGNYRFNFYPYESYHFRFKSWISKEEMRAAILTMKRNILVGDIYCKLAES